jgi:hypothetical protein
MCRLPGLPRLSFPVAVTLNRAAKAFLVFILGTAFLLYLFEVRLAYLLSQISGIDIL